MIIGFLFFLCICFFCIVWLIHEQVFVAACDCGRIDVSEVGAVNVRRGCG